MAVPRRLSGSTSAVAGRRTVASVRRWLHQAVPREIRDSAAGGTGDMLDLIEKGAFVATGGGRLQPVSKTAVFREFMVPLDLEDDMPARWGAPSPPSACVDFWARLADGIRRLFHRLQTNHRFCIATRTRLLRREDATLVNPGLGAFVHALRIRLKHETLAGSKTPHIDQRSVPFW
jgi:hypothetical protein